MTLQPLKSPIQDTRLLEMEQDASALDHEEKDQQETLLLENERTSPLRKLSTNSYASSSPFPRDTYNLVYFLLFFLGAGMLWPYNTLVGAPAYLESVYPNSDVETLVPAVLNYPSIIMLLLMVRYGSRFSFSVRIITCFVLISLCLIGIPFITSTSYLSKDVSEKIFFTVTFISGIQTAILQSSIYGFASILPPAYTQAVMGGNGIAGLFTSLLRMLTKVVFPASDLRPSALLFFFISAVFTFSCTFAYILIVRQPFTKHHFQSNQQSRRNSLTNSDKDEQLLEASPSDPSVLVDSPWNVGDHAVESVGAQDVPTAPLSSLDYWFIIKKTCYMGSNVMLIFVLTFLLFPGKITSVESYQGISKDWFPLLMITVFNAFDLLGRLAPSWTVLFSNEWLWLPVALRYVLYPLIFMYSKAIGFHSDLWIYLFTALLGISNGYLASLGMMAGPSYVSPAEREAAGYIMTVWLMTGILLGAHIAYLIDIL